MRVEVPDHRELGHLAQEPLDPAMGPGVARHRPVAAARRLVGQGVLHDVHLVRPFAVPVADEQAEALALVDLDGGDEEAPEGVLGDVGDHGRRLSGLEEEPKENNYRNDSRAGAPAVSVLKPRSGTRPL